MAKNEKGVGLTLAHAIGTDAVRAIRVVLETYPDHRYEVLEAFALALVGQSYSLGEDGDDEGGAG